MLGLEGIVHLTRHCFPIRGEYMFLHVSLAKGTELSCPSPCLKPKLVYVEKKKKNFDLG